MPGAKSSGHWEDMGCNQASQQIGIYMVIIVITAGVESTPPNLAATSWHHRSGTPTSSTRMTQPLWQGQESWISTPLACMFHLTFLGCGRGRGVPGNFDMRPQVAIRNATQPVRCRSCWKSPSALSGVSYSHLCCEPRDVLKVQPSAWTFSGS